MSQTPMSSPPQSIPPALRSPRRELRQAAGIVWRRQGVLWWIFLVNFLLAAMATVPVAARLAPILGHSLAGERFVRGFDVTALLELAMQPSHPFNSATTPAALSLLFFVFMVFIEGGVLKLYWLDKKLAAGEFFEACGGCFWRFVRLVLLSLIGFVPLFLLAHVVVHWSGRLAKNAPQPRLGFEVEVIGLLIVLFLLLVLRLWFDLAQVRVAVENDRGAAGALRRTFPLLRRNFFSLFWLYLRPSLVGWALFAAILWISMTFVPHKDFAVSFLLGELALLLWLGTRLWQRAAEIVWYTRRALAGAGQP